MSGTLPSQLGNIARGVAGAKQKTIKFQDNMISGFIPTELGLLGGGLTSLQLVHNRISGTIPSELALASNLRILALHRNRLSGAIPAQLSQLQHVETCYLTARGAEDEQFTNELDCPQVPLPPACADGMYANVEFVGPNTSACPPLPPLAPPAPPMAPLGCREWWLGMFLPAECFTNAPQQHSSLVAVVAGLVSSIVVLSFLIFVWKLRRRARYLSSSLDRANMDVHLLTHQVHRASRPHPLWSSRADHAARTGSVTSEGVADSTSTLSGPVSLPPGPPSSMANEDQAYTQLDPSVRLSKLVEQVVPTIALANH